MFRSFVPALLLPVAALLSLAVAPAFGDPFEVTVTSSDDLYTATAVLGVGLGFASDLFINGPDGTIEYEYGTTIEGGTNFQVNDYGQVVGWTDGGTGDPTVWYAEYYANSFGTFLGAGPFLEYAPVGIAACFLDFSAGPSLASLACPPLLGPLTLSDTGLVTVGFFVPGNPALGVPSSELYKIYQLPNSAPEPSSIALLVTVVGVLMAGTWFRRKIELGRHDAARLADCAWQGETTEARRGTRVPRLSQPYPIFSRRAPARPALHFL
jgi:hypothetical protein